MSKFEIRNSKQYEINSKPRFGFRIVISRKGAKGAKVRRNKYPGLSLRAWRLGAINSWSDFSSDFELRISDFCPKITFFPYWTKVQYTIMMDPCMVVSNLCS